MSGIVEFNMSDGIPPLVMQKLNANFQNLIGAGVDHTGNIITGTVYPDNATDGAIFYNTETGDISVWRNLGEAWGWSSATSADIAGIEQAVQEALELVEAIDQHFWTDTQGAHVTDITQDEWQEEITSDDPFDDVSDSKPYNNLLLNSLGILLRSALNNLVSITRSAISFFDGLGNNAENIVATFGRNGVRIGEETGIKTIIGSGEFKIVDPSNILVTRVIAYNTHDGLAWVSMNATGDGSKTTFYTANKIDASIGVRGCYYIGGEAFEPPTISGDYSLVFATPPDARPFRVEYATPDLLFSATFGTRRSGQSYGSNSMCIGTLNAATASTAVAIGANNYATENDSYAIGKENTSSALESYAIGRGLKASSSGQMALGRFNIEDTAGVYTLIIGNGTSNSNRSNALAVTAEDGGLHQWTDISFSSPSASNDYNDALINYDSDGNQIGYMQIVNRSSGVYRSIAAQNPRLSSDNVCALYLVVDDDGSRHARLSGGVAWPITNGGTGATSAAGARTNLGLGSLATKDSVALGYRVIESTSAKNSSAIASGANVNFTCACTVPSGYIFAGIQRVGRTGGAGLVLLGYDASDTGSEAILSFRNMGSSPIPANSASATCEFRFIRATAS